MVAPACVGAVGRWGCSLWCVSLVLVLVRCGCPVSLVVASFLLVLALCRCRSLCRRCLRGLRLFGPVRCGVGLGLRVLCVGCVGCWLLLGPLLGLRGCAGGVPVSRVLAVRSVACCLLCVGSLLFVVAWLSWLCRRCGLGVASAVVASLCVRLLSSRGVPSCVPAWLFVPFLLRCSVFAVLLLLVVVVGCSVLRACLVLCVLLGRCRLCRVVWCSGLSRVWSGLPVLRVRSSLRSPLLCWLRGVPSLRRLLAVLLRCRLVCVFVLGARLSRVAWSFRSRRLLVVAACRLRLGCRAFVALWLLGGRLRGLLRRLSLRRVRSCVRGRCLSGACLLVVPCWLGCLVVCLGSFGAELRCGGFGLCFFFTRSR